MSVLFIAGQPFLMYAAMELWMMYERGQMRAGAPRARSPYSIIIILATPIAASIIALAAWSLLWMRSKRLVQRLDFRVCPRCQYNLTANPTDGACPECGRAYIDADLRRDWKAAYRL